MIVREGFRLRDLPASARIMLTAFLVMLGGGYLVAVANIRVQLRLKDADPAPSFNDVRIHYAGMDVEVTAGRDVPSRIMEQILGEMHQYFEGEAEFELVRTWLNAGGTKEEFEKETDGVSPSGIVFDRCLRCHNPDGEDEEASESPFGPDIFEPPDFELLGKYVSAPPEEPEAEKPTSQKADSQPGPQTRRVGPQTLGRLIHVTHAHILTIPVFTLMVGGLFLLTGLPQGLRRFLAPVPMLAMVVDFAAWWLARVVPGVVVLIVVTGAVYGAIFGFQVLAVLGSMWFGRRSA